MTAFIRKYLRKRDKNLTRSRHLREKRVAAKSTFLLKNRRLTIAIVVATTFALALISFWGQAPSGPRISADQLARVQVTAEFPFTYISKIQTDREKERQRKQVAPIYSVSYQHFSEFEVFINNLNDLMLKFSQENRDLSKSQQEEQIEALLNETIQKSKFSVDVNGILTLYRETDFRGRYRLLQQGLTELWYIYREGIFSPVSQRPGAVNRYSLVKITDGQGQTREVQFKTPTEALLDLRVRLNRLENSEIIYQSLFEIMKEGIVVNLFYNEADHTREINAVVEQIKPVEVPIKKGDTIIELGSIVTARDMEKLSAYEDQRRKEAKSAPIMGDFMQEKVFYMLILLAVSITFIALTFPRNEQTNSHYLMCALMIIINMSAIRMVLELGESSLFSETNSFSHC